MKILLATPLYPPEIGGPATYAHMLEQLLPAHDIEVEIVPFSTARKWPKIIRHIMYFVQLLRVIKDCDMVYALDPSSVGLPAALAAKFKKKLFLLRVPGDYAWEQGQVRFGVTDVLDVFVARKNRYHPVVRFLVRLESYVARQAEIVIVPSEYMKRIVTTWGVHPARIKPIYSALFPLPVSEERSALRTMFGYRGKTIISVGRLVPWKGFDTLIELLPQLRTRVPDANLVIVGDGPMGARLKARTRELNLTDHVRFLDRQPKQALGAAIAAADAFVLNTAYEGLSHQLLEVMDLGVPIVTTDVGGNPELIKDTVTGILVEHNNVEELLTGIERALTHESFTKHMVANARLRVKEFAQEKVILDLVHTLKSVS
jgi:glycosyltransferase involved in cell wall biosynthesis